MKKLAVHLQRGPGDWVVVGQVAEAERRIYFEYVAAFLGRGLELSPFKLPTQIGLIEHRDRAFGPLPGMLDDSLPDGWGLLLMDRLFRQRGLRPTAVSPLQRLSYLGSRTMGALTYHSNEDSPGEEQLLNLHLLGNKRLHVHTFGNLIHVNFCYCPVLLKTIRSCKLSMVPSLIPKISHSLEAQRLWTYLGV